MSYTKRWSLISLAWLGVLVPALANANDSIASLGVGGLELQKTDDVQMVSEVLEVSAAKIRVTYRFLNTSGKDIKSTVAFPMPARLVSEEVDENRVPGPVESFRSLADGKPVTFYKNQVLLVNGVDMTGQLRKIGLSDGQIFGQNAMCLRIYDQAACGMAASQIAALNKMLRHDDTQRWKMEIKDIPYWEQVFPAGREVEVIHEYVPFPGGRMGDSGYLDMKKPGKDREACLDDKTRMAIYKRLQGDEEHGPAHYFWVYRVDYILGTGRNWSGPIRDFRLIVKKSAPGELASLCFPGSPAKTSPTTLEFAQKDYVPQDQLTVLFYDIRN